MLWYLLLEGQAAVLDRRLKRRRQPFVLGIGLDQIQVFHGLGVIAGIAVVPDEFAVNAPIDGGQGRIPADDEENRNEARQPAPHGERIAFADPEKRCGRAGQRIGP